MFTKILLYDILNKAQNNKFINYKGEIIMSNYLNDLLNSEKTFRLEDERTIITDRMGPWSNQNLVLAWETANGNPCVSPNEAEVLFEYGKLSNVQRNYRGELYMEFTFSDIRSFDGAIVCGILSPELHLREEILEYAKGMGYITDKPVDIEMFNGTKSLICNPDGTYKITFVWSQKVKENCNAIHMYQFTQKYFAIEFQRECTHLFNQPAKKYYSNPKFEISNEGFSIDNLRACEVFNRENIDAIREYDIQLWCLSTKIDKNLLLKGLIQVGFAAYSVPENLQIKYDATLREKHSENNLPLYQYTPKLGKENKSVTLKSGIATYSYLSDYAQYTVSYHSNVPYSEYVRSIMKNFETLMQKAYQGEHCYVRFDPYRESVYFCVNKKEEPEYSLCSQFEKEIVILDYAISLYQMFGKLNDDQMLFAIMKFYASDVNFPYRELFTFYYSLLKNRLAEEK